MTAVHNSYLQGKVLGAEPLALICILYSTALQNVQAAIESLDAGDAVARAKATDKALDALGMLTAALDLAEGGELGRNLLNLYLYMQRRLTEAHALKSKAGFQEIHRLLTTLASAWTELANRSRDSRPPEGLLKAG